jgi:recombination DNA repair RAD52 pathway protein
MNREILEKPFGPEQIKQREGNFGKMLDYIEGHAVIQRLNDAFDATGRLLSSGTKSSRRPMR